MTCTASVQAMFSPKPVMHALCQCAVIGTAVLPALIGASSGSNQQVKSKSDDSFQVK